MDINDIKQEVIKLTKQVVAAVANGDFNTYTKLVDSSISCFEPVSMGSLVLGMDFHKFYFDNVLSKDNKPVNTSIVDPVVHVLGDAAACIAYVRLTQIIDRDGLPVTRKRKETRVWQKKGGQWQNIHLHIS